MKKIFGLVVMAMSMLFAANAMASTSVESVTSLTNAKVENGTLEFDMAVHGTYLSIIKFPASFHFKGTLK